MADSPNDNRKPRRVLLAIMVGLAVVVAVFQAVRPIWQAKFMETAVSSWCVRNYLDRRINCYSWAANMMSQHQDEIMACESSDFDTSLDCIGDLGLKP